LFTGFSAFVIQNVVIYVLTLGTPFGLPQWLWLNAAKCCAVGLGMIWNYLTYKKVVFRERDGMGGGNYEQK
jgi:putative flippase GtrA